ncbi:MAG TPA: AraC family transcriptional regulator [Thermoanaerobaculia bacterium]|jgi:AraC-like DNA-binding protein|nr:AraC family transcriptional regulator [Thermoanaerobaculia bacterium]
MSQILEASPISQTAPAGPLAGLAERIGRWAPQEGRNASPWPGLTFFRASRPSVRIPVVYEPCLCFVAQGKKRAFLGGRAYTYDPQNYLVLSVPLPIESEILEASPQEPFLSLALRIDVAEVSDLLLEMAAAEPRPARSQPAQPGIFVSRMHDPLAGVVLRFLDALEDSMDRRILAPLAVREILYHVLAGEQGGLLRAVALHDGRSHRIAHVLRYLNAHYDQPLDISSIANAAYMSPSTLHHTFKAVTSVSPLQYLKRIRLHQARLLMLHDGLSAGEVAHRVGYESPSQFSREFKRLFGVAPTQEVQRLRRQGVDWLARERPSRTGLYSS